MNLNLFALANATQDASNMWSSMLVYGGLIVVVVVMFVFMNRKQKKQEKEVADMRSGLRVGDEVTTTGGIVGRIVQVKEETVVLETSRDGTKIRFRKESIARVDVPVYTPPKDEPKKEEVKAEPIKDDTKPEKKKRFGRKKQ